MSRLPTSAFSKSLRRPHASSLCKSSGSSFFSIENDRGNTLRPKLLRRSARYPGELGTTVLD
ncbi:unnamed protein product, partial [Amoebophrya sp. A25]|eukprot:GSA25T00011255001.1